MSLVGEVAILIGAGWSLLAAVGVNRFGDVYARMHSATKSTTLGVLLVLLGSALHLPGGDGLKVLLAAVLLFLTAPVGAHLIGRAVHGRQGAALVRIDTVDELAEAEADDSAP